MTHGWICGPRIYQFEGWRFEYGNVFPWPLRKDGELRKRAGRKFYTMIKRFDSLSKDEQEKHRVGGGCRRF